MYCVPLPNHHQDKDALPQGLLSSSYKEGVVFVTYSLLAMSNQVPGVKTGPLAKALHVSGGGSARCHAQQVSCSAVLW